MIKITNTNTNTNTNTIYNKMLNKQITLNKNTNADIFLILNNIYVLLTDNNEILLKKKTKIHNETSKTYKTHKLQTPTTIHKLNKLYKKFNILENLKKLNF